MVTQQTPTKVLVLPTNFQPNEIRYQESLGLSAAPPFSSHRSLQLASAKKEDLPGPVPLPSVRHHDSLASPSASGRRSILFPAPPTTLRGAARTARRPSVVGRCCATGSRSGSRRKRVGTTRSSVPGPGLVCLLSYYLPHPPRRKHFFPPTFVHGCVVGTAWIRRSFCQTLGSESG